MFLLALGSVGLLSEAERTSSFSFFERTAVFFLLRLIASGVRLKICECGLLILGSLFLLWNLSLIFFLLSRSSVR